MIFLCSLLSTTAYSQSVDANRLQDNNTRIAERLECTALIALKEDVIKRLDSSLAATKAIVEQQSKQIAALQQNNELAIQREEQTALRLAEATTKRLEAEVEASRLKKGRNTWRMLSLLQTVLIAGVTLITIR